MLRRLLESLSKLSGRVYRQLSFPAASQTRSFFNQFLSKYLHILVKRPLPAQYCSDKTDLTPLTPLPYQGRGEPDSPLLVGEGLGERLTEQYCLPA